MRVRELVLACLLLVGSFAPSFAAFRISNDPGGQIGPYLDRFAALRNSGQSVMIDGPCLSACTMLLGIIPRERICVTSRARLGFHAAWNPGQNGQPVTSPAATKFLMDIYPEHVKTWIKGRGGLQRRMIVLSGPELAAMYPSCQQQIGLR